MTPQYLAAQTSGCGRNEALATHRLSFSAMPYEIPSDCTIIRVRNTQVSLASEPGSARHEAVPGPKHANRRHECPKASNSWQPSVSSPLSPPAPAARPTRNTWWSGPSRSRQSPSTPASTSILDRGQAAAPVP
ncbi:unnamed protein product, partial [Chrysoparadoxa australica]